MHFGFNIKRTCCTVVVGFVTLLTGQIATAAFGDSDLRPYFVKYRLLGETSSWAEYTPNVPVVHVVVAALNHRRLRHWVDLEHPVY